MCRYAHQIEGVNWLWKMHQHEYGGALLADDMGLGKTVQVCAFLQCLYSAELLSSCLIVCPASILHVWETTFKEWTSLDSFIKITRYSHYPLSWYQERNKE